MSITFKTATKSQAKARILLSAASGAGKTTAALTLASSIGKKIAVIDTEAGSASLYADRFAFDVLELSPPYEPERFIEAIAAAESAGYDVIVLDSITHEWSGPGGCLEIKTKMGDRFQDWAKVTPRHDKFIQAMMRSKAHIIATVRAKQGYSMDERGKVQKQGMDPQQRDGIDFEFTICWNINAQHLADAQKDRTRLFDGKPEIITADTGKRLMEWLNSGAAVGPKPPTLGEAYNAAIAKGHTKEVLLAKATEVAGYPIAKSSDVSEIALPKVIAAWSAM